jgi:hypothetical protein
VTRYILGDLRTGKRILDLPVLTGPWDDNLDTAEAVKVTVDLNDPEVRKLDLRNSSAPTKTFLCVVEGGQMKGGPIWTRSYDVNTRVLTLSGKGMGSYFDHRLILPLLARDLPVSQWTIPDPTDTATPPRTIANPALTSSYSGIWLGTIAKRLVQQAQAWTGGNVPIVFQADEASSDASHVRNYLGTAFKPVGEALDDLTNVIGGPEINFEPRFTSDGLGVEWVMQVGTTAQPLLTSVPQPVVWDVTVPQSQVSDLVMAEDASKMASNAWLTGGNQSDNVLVARAIDATLVNLGYPLMESFDSSHQSVSEQATLDGYAAAAVLAGRRSTEVWSFTVEAYPTDETGAAAGPQADAYTTGDFANLIIAPYDEDSGRGIPYLPDGGTFQMRIIGRSGDETGQQIKLKCAPLIQGG